MTALQIANDFLDAAGVRVSQEFGTLNLLIGNDSFSDWKEEFENRLGHGKKPKEVLDVLPIVYALMVKEIQEQQLTEEAKQKLLGELEDAYKFTTTEIVNEAADLELKRTQEIARKAKLQSVRKNGVPESKSDYTGLTKLPHGSMLSSQGTAKDKSPIYGIEFIKASKKDMAFFAEKLLEEYGEGAAVKIDAGNMLEHPLGTLWGKPNYLELQRQLLLRGLTPVPLTLDISEQEAIRKLKQPIMTMPESEKDHYLKKMESAVEKWKHPVAAVGQKNGANKENVGVNMNIGKKKEDFKKDSSAVLKVQKNIKKENQENINPSVNGVKVTVTSRQTRKKM